MIAVISDSHIPSRAQKIPEKFEQKLEEADIVVHCGDFETEQVYNDLKQYGELIGVKGNCDRFKLDNSVRFKRKNIDFAVYHGSGIQPRGHHPTLINAANKIGGDVLFHGHTHQQEVVKKEGKILLNPGSCTGAGGATADSGNPKMMLVYPDQELRVELLKLEDEELHMDEESFRI